MDVCEASLTTAEVTNRNLYKSLEIFARRPHGIFESIPIGFVGGRQGYPKPLRVNSERWRSVLIHS